VDDRRHDDSVRGAVAPEAIGDEAVRDTAAPLEQLAKEPRGGVAIPAGLEQDVDDLAILVDGPPEVLTRPRMVTKSSSRCHVSPTGPERRRSRRA
jgi:hypothetical protein